ncbi:MAG: penicillin-binding protein 1A [Hyphomicrobiaceae bacterium]|nr:penicillin-binding protein 1A [Hyphomicrobiaceae bacterium]
MRAPVLPPPVKTKKRKRRSLLLSLMGYGFAALVAAFIVGSGIVGYLLYKNSRDLPDYESLAKYEPPVMTRIHAHDGSLISEYARERRIFVPINTIPKPIINAFLSAEDKRFYEHGGLDFGGMLRAVVNNAAKGFKGGLQGASTITQQVAKNFLLSSEQKLERKIKEAILAVRIERAYSKDRILELYLNEIFFGLNSYGIAAASLNYFNKELRDLEPHEAAYLAALPKAPNNYHPFRYTQRALDRRNWILDQMVLNGQLEATVAAASKKKPLGVNPRQFGTFISTAEYFAEEVRRSILGQYGEDKLYTGGMSVRTTLDPRLQNLAKVALTDGLVRFDRNHGWRGPVSRIDISGDWGVPLAAIEMPHDIQPWRMGAVLSVDRNKATIGLRPTRQSDNKLAEAREAVEIGLDEVKWAKNPQKKAEIKAVTEVLAVGDVVYVAPKDRNNLAGIWSLMQIPEVGGGLVAMDPHTGRVLALAGGFSFAMSQFDRATQARRQPGSSFKPLVYAAAIDNGYKPTSIVLDAPIEIDQGPGKEAWNPKNYEEGKFGGPSTLRIGIEKSRNQMTVRLAQDMGMPLITEYSRRFGVYDDLLPVLSMSLGAGETTLLRMTTAYAMIANGGKHVRATLIDRIQDRWGRSIWRHDDRECRGCKAASWDGAGAEPELADDRKQVLDPHTAYQMTSIMEGVVQRGTATVIREKYLPNTPVAGKTGTTNDEKDAWFIGYTPDLVVGVYVGYDTPRPMGKGMTGGALAAPIFGDFVKQALGDKPPVPFRVPPGLKFVRVDLKTGLRLNPGEQASQTLQEAFKPGEEPDDASSALGVSAAQSNAAGSGVPGVSAPTQIGRGGVF